MRSATAVLIATLLLAVHVHASDLASREQAALDLIHFSWQQLKYDIVFRAPRPGLRAMTFPAQHRIEVYARPNDDVRMLAYDIAHELGHAIDVTYNTAETRKNWLKMRGIDPSTPWFGCNACTDFETPAGDFAETFALLLLGPKDFHGRIAPPPTAQQTSALSSFFTSLSNPTLTATAN
jgi:hypothetical protein